jgi:conjugal transfer pilus assembly protein TraU
MNRLFLIGVIALFALRAEAILNPAADVNFDCMNPFVIAKGVSFGSSGILTKAGDLYDEKRSGSTGVICTCNKGGIPQVGIPMGMSLPTHIFETTLKPYYFPSLEEAGEAGESVEGYGDMDSDDTGEAYTYTHLINLNIMLLLDIFTDVLCVKAGGEQPLDIGYLSEVDPMAESSSTANYLFPESVLASNPVVALSCIADSGATLIGLTLDAMYWCVGGHVIYPLSNYTQQTTSADDAAMQNIIKTMYRINRISRGFTFGITTAPVTTSGICEEVNSLSILKSQYRMQPAMPFVHRGCPRLGAPSILWNTPKKALNGDMVVIIWTRKDCCAL